MDNLYRNKKILIFGLGLNDGGVGAAKFFARNKAEVRVTDLKSKEILQPSLEKLKEFRSISYTLREHRFEDIDWADIIIRNPAIKDNNPYLKYAHRKGKKVETDFSIFLNFVDQKKIIAITGTKGKSTTASLIYQAIKESGKKVILAGNIGKSVLSTIPFLKDHSWVVVEISSFQLQALKGKNFAPRIALLTNIYPDHLNWHASMDEYIQAKRIIALDQSKDDFFIIPCSESHVDFYSKEFWQGIKSQPVNFCSTCERDIYQLLENASLPLVGPTNKDNYAAALTVCDLLKIAPKTAIRGFKKFKGGEFRMQFLGTFNDISIFNDSTATNPIATMTALQILGRSNVILITGGMNKGMNYTSLAKTIGRKVKKVFFLEGDSTEEIKKLIHNKSLIAGTYNNLEKLLLDVKRMVKSKDVILFSPAATSFNLFQNEFDRGRKFNEAVSKVFGSNNI